MKMLSIALVVSFSLTAVSAPAQVAPDETRPVPKATAPAQSADAKKKAVAKKPAAPKKDVSKAPPAPKAQAPVVPGNSSVRVYKAGDPSAPTLRDKDGNVLPTNPGAYDVSSAKK